MVGRIGQPSTTRMQTVGRLGKKEENDPHITVAPRAAMVGGRTIHSCLQRRTQRVTLLLCIDDDTCGGN